MKYLLLILIFGATYLESNTQSKECSEWTRLHTDKILTPDGDNINDEWRITYDLYCWEDVEFWIYDSEGKEVYHDFGESFDLYPYWDGTMKGEYVPNGQYFYTINAVKINTGVLTEKKGSFKIFKK